MVTISRMPKHSEFTRTLADQIATDLIEGGINRKWTTSLTAESRNVSIETVRTVRRFLLARGKEHMTQRAGLILGGWADSDLGIIQSSKIKNAFVD